MKHLLRYIPLLFISFLTYCTTTEEGLDRAEVMQLSTGSIEAEALGGASGEMVAVRIHSILPHVVLGRPKRVMRAMIQVGLSYPLMQTKALPR